MSDSDQVPGFSVNERLVGVNDDRDLKGLIDKARSGSSSELGRLLDFFRPALTEQADCSLGDPIRRRFSVSDLVQDTLLTACEQFSAFRGNTSAEFRDWLNQIFHSRLIDGFRRHQGAERRRQSSEDHQTDLEGLADSQLSPSAIAAVRDDAQNLLRVMQQLPEESQKLIRMRYLENLSFETISQQTGVPLATVWRRFQEATNALHQQLTISRS